MKTIAQIATIVLQGQISLLSDNDLQDANHAVQFAIDPCHLGDEPHLRCEVDSCGISEDQLIVMDQVLWAEVAKRNDARIEANWRQGPPPLQMAA